MVSELFVIDRVRRAAVDLPVVFTRAPLSRRRAFAAAAPFSLVWCASVIGLLVADHSQRPMSLFQMMMISGLNLIPLAGIAAHRRVAWNGLRVMTRGDLRLVGGEFSGMLPVLAGLCILAACGVALWSHTTPGFVSVGSSGRSGVVFPAILGLSCLIAVLVKSLRPSGVLVTEQGITVCHGMRRHPIEWGDLASVSVTTSGRRNAKLEVASIRGPSYSLPAMVLGSNPHYAAELLTYYLRNRDRRWLLRDSQAAVREVFELMR